MLAEGTPIQIEIPVGRSHSVFGLLDLPPEAQACCVVAHGAGAGMTHPFMAAIADGLAARRIASLRYQFPYMQAGGRRPDPAPLAQATVRAAVVAAAHHAPALALFAGGKSFGGRMTSQAQSTEPLPGVLGLVFFGFPLHPAGKPSIERATHLERISVPMLFLQGTRDALAEQALIGGVVERLGERGTMVSVEGGDHSFHVPARSGRSDQDAIDEALDAMAAWVGRVLA